MSNNDDGDPGTYESGLETERIDIPSPAEGSIPQSIAPSSGTFISFPGEETKQVIEVECIDACSDGHIRGKLRLTNYRLFFSAAEGDIHDIDIPIHSILKIEKTGRGENSYRLDITCKYFLSVTFIFNRQERKDLYKQIVSLAFPADVTKLFAFDNKKRFKENGWEVYNFKREYTRMGALGKEDSKWRHSEINKDYELIESYPSDIIVPVSITDEFLKKATYFRSRGRIIALSWMHPSNNASITRCSQPLVGISKKRCTEDEEIVSAINKANITSTHVYICDCRPSVNARANQAKGKGFELGSIYDNTEFSFGNIENIHEVRSSNERLRELVTPVNIDEQKWFSNLENTKWLYHIMSILKEAVKVASIIENKKSSVVVHCSDGWDRTSQITSLSMLLLDPYYRTLHGFEVLIEKEWISFGHQFQTRICHGMQEPTNNYAQIFIQWLDCVWQVIQHYPHVFEFNAKLLSFIAHHVYSCLFGTFIFDNEHERHEHDVRNRTQSIWSFINSCQTEFLNPLYLECKSVILPTISMRTIRLWKEYWMSYHPFYRFQDPLFERIMELVHLREKVQQNCDELRSRNKEHLAPIVKISVNASG